MTLIACGELVERGDPDRFLSTMSARPEERAKLFPLFAFNLEVARAPWVTQESMIAEMRLQWWRDVIEAIGEGKPVDGHEIIVPLTGVITESDLPVVLFDQMIEARRWDIYRDPFEDQAGFETYIDRTSGHLMWLAAKAIGAADPLETDVREVAFASGVANWLCAVADLESRGRIPLLDGRPDGVRDLARMALARLNAVRRRDFGAAVAALRTGWRARAILKLAIDQPRRVADGTLGTSEFQRRASLVVKSVLAGW